MTYDFQITESAKPFDLVLGFARTSTGNAAAQIVVDDITLTYLRPAEDLLARDYDPSALWFDATDAKYAAAKNVEVTPTAANQIIKAAAADQFSGLTKNMIVSGTCANLVITDGSPLEVQEAFTATEATYSRNMNNKWGSVILPYALSSNNDVKFFILKSTADDKMTFTPVETVEANTPITFQKVNDETTSITLSANNVNVIATTADQNTSTQAEGWTTEGFYSSNTITDCSQKGLYYISSNKFWRATGTLNLNPFRTIFKNTNSNVKSFIINFDETDGIEDVRSLIEDGRETEIYNIAGQRLQKIQRGVNIVNGKKVIIK